MRWRAVVAALALGGLGAAALASDSIAWGAMTVAAATLFLRRSVLAQAIARAVAWATVLPSVFVAIVLATTMGLAPPPRLVALAAVAAVALVVSRPLLATDEARASFAPAALRSWFLAAAIGAMASGIALASLAAAFAQLVWMREVVGLSALAVALVGAGIGVVRMRTWGVVLGVLAALSSVPLATWMHDGLLAVPSVLATLPGALMGATVLAARAVARRGAPELRRVAPQVRVAAEPSLETCDPHEAESIASVASRSRFA